MLPPCVSVHMYLKPSVDICIRTLYSSVVICSHLCMLFVFGGKFTRRGLPEANVAFVWRQLREYYAEHRVQNRFRILKLSMFVGSGLGGYPMLRGKAATIKDVMPALMSIWKRGGGEDVGIVRLVGLALETCAALDCILEEHLPPRLPPAVARDFFAKIALFCQLCSELQNWNGLKVFNLTQKAHYMMHVAFRARHMNPRMSWCFRGEDFMQHMRKLLLSCSRGNPRHLINNEAVQKWRRWMHLSLRDCAKLWLGCPKMHVHIYATVMATRINFRMRQMST